MRRSTRRPRRALILAIVTTATLGLGMFGPMAPVANAATITVDTLVDGTGVAGCTLREAIINANDDAATHAGCPAGTGLDTITFGVAGTIDLTGGHLNVTDADGLLIDGPGSGSLTIDQDTASSRVFNVAAGGVLSVRDVTVSGGDVNGATAVGPGEGGGFRNLGSLTLVNDVTVTGNVAGSGSVDTFGGGIFNSGTLAVTNSTIELNRSDTSGDGEDARGGGIYSAGSGTVTITDSTIEANTAEAGGLDGDVAQGGGIWSDDPLILTNTDVLNNSTDTFNGGGAGDSLGGGIYAIDPVTIQTGSRVAGNLALADNDDGDVALGGGILFVGDGNLTISGGSAVDNNDVISWGDDARGAGIYAVSSGSTTITSSSVSDNIASARDGSADQAEGGGIYTDDPLTLTDTDVNDNEAEASTNDAGDAAGGGIYSTDPLTIESGSTVNGNAASSGDDAGDIAQGGGIFVDTGFAVTISSSTIDGNAATSVADSAWGGGIWADAASAVTGTTISNNAASGDNEGRGGGIYSSGTLALSTSTVSSNTADGGNDVTGTDRGIGGGISLEGGGAHTITSSTITGNTSRNDPGSDDPSFGGGIDLDSATSLSVTASTVSLNTVSSQNGAPGGGIWSDSPLTISDSTIDGNVARNDGTAGDQASTGGGIQSFGPLTILGTTISGNTAGQTPATDPGADAFGGGVALVGSSASITNSTLSGNAARTEGVGSDGHGGGVYAAVPVTLSHTTIASNTAASGNPPLGGGVYRAGGTTTLRGSILADNTAVTGLDCFGPVVSSGFNVVETLCTGGGLTGTDIAGDPGLAPLASNGGPTMTHAIGPGSIATNLVPTTDCSTFLGGNMVDQRGIARPQDDVCEAGAYELVQVGGTPTTTLVVTLAGDGSGRVTGTGIDCPGDCSQTHAPNVNTTVTAAADPGSEFLGWSGYQPCNGLLTPCQVHLQATTVVTAHFGLEGTPVADLGLSASTSAGQVGSDHVFTFTVANTGADDEPNAIVTGQITGRFQGGTPQALAAGDCLVSATGAFSCQVGEVPAGGSASVDLHLVPTRGGVLSVTGTVDGDGVDTNLLNDSAGADAQIALVCTIRGTRGPDQLVGTEGVDVICGRGGDDHIEGLGGDDVLRGGFDDDTILGGEGHDRLIGGRGDDTLLGGPGVNSCVGGSGSNSQSNCGGSDGALGVDGWRA